MKKTISFPAALLLGAGLFFASFHSLWADVDGEDLSIDPRAYWHYVNALYAQHAGDVDRSLVEFQQAARYDPTSSAIHDRLAYHYYVEGLDYKSVEELQKSIELQPNNISTRLMLANLFSTQGEYGKAQKE
ncbi:MAG TPA: tetratricopeptide repeat protein, partial [bacterium]|nr:tetratricopeptide repeat protein [bacterium]